jgi:radical SAM superfamily enzyme YgiQ (UPF0313 family)
MKKMAKITLVNPAIACSNWNADLTIPKMENIFIRLGLAYLSAALKQNGHEVKLIDLRTISGWDEYKNTLLEQSPEILGITMDTIEWDTAVEACRIAKQILPSLIIIAGGVHPTTFPQDCINTGVIDYVLQGEGELTFVEFVKKPHDFPKIFYGQPPELDKLPLPDRELWQDYPQRVRSGIFKFPGIDPEPPMVDIMCMRGCPWKCRFCCGPGSKHIFTRQINGKRIPFVRARSVDNVMQEIDYLDRKYHLKSILFDDDQFIVSPKWVKEFCIKMHQYGFVKKQIRWICSSRVDQICKYPHIIEKMASAGLGWMIIGFESFSQRILDWFEKGTTVDQNFQATKILKQNNIKVWANYILGVPLPDGWHKEDDIATIEGIKAIEPDHFSPAFFTPVPGSPLYDWCKKMNLIIDDGRYNIVGKRYPNQPKIKGVDYEFLQKIMVRDTT